MIISFTKRLLIKLGQSFILSDKPLDNLYVAGSHFSCSESRSVACARQHHAVIWCSSQLHPPVQLLNNYQSTSEFFVITMVAYPCRCVMGLTFPSPTWLWKSSPIATICFGIHCIDPSVCFENAFHTGSKYDVAVRTTSLSFPWSKFLFVVPLFLSDACLTPLCSGRVRCDGCGSWNYSS